MAGNVWRILAIDDDTDLLKNIEEILVGEKRFLPDTIEIAPFSSFDEGIKALAQERYDIVILDLHSKTDPAAYSQMEKEDQAGEMALSSLKSIRFVPVIFYTGFPKKVEHLTSPVIKVITKGGRFDVLRDAVEDVLKTKLPHLSRHMEEQQRDYMWSAMDGEWDKVVRMVEPAELAYLVARRVAYGLSRNSVREFLGISNKYINPLEMFLYPSPKDKCSPGDVVRETKTNEMWIVLTPACDFEQGKAENVLLARVYELTQHSLYKVWIDAKKKLMGAGEKNPHIKELQTAAKVAGGDVLTLVKDRKSERYKFLSGTFFLPDCVIDFQNLKNLPLVNQSDFEQVCSLDSPFREEILHLFSRYYGRIGTPDINKDDVWAKVEASFEGKK